MMKKKKMKMKLMKNDKRAKLMPMKKMKHWIWTLMQMMVKIFPVMTLVSGTIFPAGLGLYLVVSNLFRIAQRNGTTVTHLQTINGLQNANRILGLPEALGRHPRRRATTVTVAAVRIAARVRSASRWRVALLGSEGPDMYTAVYLRQ